MAHSFMNYFTCSYCGVDWLIRESLGPDCVPFDVFADHEHCCRPPSPEKLGAALYDRGFEVFEPVSTTWSCAYLACNLSHRLGVFFRPNGVDLGLWSDKGRFVYDAMSRVYLDDCKLIDFRYTDSIACVYERILSIVDRFLGDFSVEQVGEFLFGREALESNPEPCVRRLY